MTHQKNKSNRQKSLNTEQVISHITDLTIPTTKKISQIDKNLQILTKKKVIRIPLLVMDNYDNETKHQIWSQQKPITNQKNKSNRQKSSNTKQVISHITNLTNPTTKKKSVKQTKIFKY
jgi:hypothetical protein